ncbi:universal stress protein [Amycolatopsis suaedae]|uniref:Universal stress protein n=1 Tax=Amycolatopsis suaedae TaxID=2510978 RepID=A0A4Q7JFC8_9PSEU|nr:universal stress protein [Amycolatopsis suaedae]RZQ65916.1 universal stress protein [Amycolatopsis suaedae]
MEEDMARRIVVGVDGSAASRSALRWATAEAAIHGGKVNAITVHTGDYLLPGTSFTFQPHGRVPVSGENELRRYLHGLVEQERLGDVVVVETVIEGDAATELVKAVRGGDLLVVGSHGQSRLAEVLLGSVAADCVRHSPCPVVVIPAELAGQPAQRGEDVS